MLGLRSVVDIVRRVAPSHAKASFARKPAQGARTPLLSGTRVLIVEDETVVALHMAKMVEELGCTVVKTVGTVDQALDVVSEHAIDCAILDVNLSGTLSFRLAAALRRRDIPFVYCTAYVDAASVFPEVAAAQRLGKPVRKKDLRDALVHALHSHRE